MKIINTSLLTPRNIFAISVLSIVAHLVAAPICKLVGNAPGTEKE